MRGLTMKPDKKQFFSVSLETANCNCYGPVGWICEKLLCERARDDVVSLRRGPDLAKLARINHRIRATVQDVGFSGNPSGGMRLAYGTSGLFGSLRALLKSPQKEDCMSFRVFFVFFSASGFHPTWAARPVRGRSSGIDNRWSESGTHAAWRLPFSAVLLQVEMKKGWQPREDGLERDALMISIDQVVG